MDKDVSAGSATASPQTLGHLALGLTLLAFGVANTGVIDGVSAAHAAAIATWLGGVALFVTGILAFRAGDGGSGTAFAGLGAFWFTWGIASGPDLTAEAAGLFFLLWALLSLTLTAASAGAGVVTQGVYGLFTVALVLLGVAAFAESGGLAKAGGWIAAAAGLGAWYGATAALAHWPTLSGRAAGRGVTAIG
ncbi:GPR1/FUN34/YaaH family transporter [Streptomyces sp. CAU 1734]|uniref:GPR1/FUN34/YaaH family transporter n=1 Tax=Streptomyces sp. CAU 1734 TaxID=3140360 RepID=UPI00326133E5